MRSLYEYSDSLESTAALTTIKKNKRPTQVPKYHFKNVENILPNKQANKQKTQIMQFNHTENHFKILIPMPTDERTYAVRIRHEQTSKYERHAEEVRKNV